MIIDFTDVPVVFDGDTLTIEDNRYSYGEQRFVTSHSVYCKGELLLLSIQSVRIVPVLFLQERRRNMNNEPTSRKSQTDWQRLDLMSDEDLDLSDCPEITPEMFAKAIVRRGGLPAKKAKAQVTLRVDTDVLNWFKSQGRGYQTQINQLLRAYMEAHQ